MNHKLSEKWIKASIAGTIWAASEIVLGSFLHNLSIPFSGNILTAIGVVILISISYIWNERGLFWRAGIICALMKTMSPSAVIFGPMIAIFTEGILLELSVRLLGRTIPGYIIGAMLAMSWNLFQKIGTYIIYYGSDIIDVYSNLLKMAQKQLNIQTDIVWLPIIALLVIHALFGLFAALIGIRVGRKMLRQPAQNISNAVKAPSQEFFHNAGNNFNYSVTWLFIDIVLIIASFFLLSHTSWFIWSTSITGMVIVWSLRYKRAMRQLSKPKFWIFFVVITLITAFVFTKAGSGENFWQKGLLTGIQMNFRAVVMIVGFSTLGTELYNPAVRNFFVRTSFKNLPLALELSVESLPSFISAIPDFKSLIKNPVSIFYQVLSHAGSRLNEIKEKTGLVRKVFLITGSRDEGKTTYAKNLVEFFRRHDSVAAGILSEKIIVDSEIKGYDLVNIENGNRDHFLCLGEVDGNEMIGKFSICREGLAMGKRILSSLSASPQKIVIIDEVGMLELRNGGWSESLENLLGRSGNPLLMIVRDEFVDEVKKKWNLDEAVIINIRRKNYMEGGLLILKHLNKSIQ